MKKTISIAVAMLICVSVAGLLIMGANAINSAETAANQKYTNYQKASLDATAQVQAIATDQSEIDQNNATETAIAMQIKADTTLVNADQYVYNGLGHSIRVSHNAATNVYSFTDNIGKQPNSATYIRVGKQAIFNIELSTWAGNLHPDTVTVHITGPSGATLLTATLQKATAIRLNWGSLDPGSAWNTYDSTTISPILSSN